MNPCPHRQALIGAGISELHLPEAQIGSDFSNFYHWLMTQLSLAQSNASNPAIIAFVKAMLQGALNNPLFAQYATIISIVLALPIFNS